MLRASAAVMLLACMAIGPAGAAVAAGPDPLLYCDGTLDGGATGALTGAEHDVLIGDDPLPAGVRQRRITVDAISTRVLEAGPATAEEAVVFVHGNPDSARDFDALLASTGRFGRAVAFDMPGYGRADDRAGLDYSTPGAARFIGRVLEQLGIRAVHLVAHDFAGPWSLQFVTTHTDAVRSVTLLDSGVFIGSSGSVTSRTFQTPGAGEAFMAVTNRAAFKTLIATQNPLPERFLDRLYDDYDRLTRCAILRYYRSESADALGRAQAALLRGADIPALVVWGDKDPYVPVALAAQQRQAFPSARIEILHGIGHWPHVEAPVATEQLVTGFLRDRVRLPRLFALPLRPRAGARKLALRIRVAGAPSTPHLRLTLQRGGRLAGSARDARTVDAVARRVVITLRRPLRRGTYTLTLTSAELPVQTQPIRVR